MTAVSATTALLSLLLLCCCCRCCCCRSYEVTGAAQALRGMWPLVFSKVEAVRESVLDSWNILHLHDKTAKEQVRCTEAWLTEMWHLWCIFAPSRQAQPPCVICPSPAKPHELRWGAHVLCVCRSLSW